MADQPYIRETTARKVGDSAAEYSVGGHLSAETSRFCAYNQTRERFLCADVEAADFTASSLDFRLGSLTPKSGTAFWLVPFRGISPTSVRVPLDLLYLDGNCNVLDVVESFPLSQSTPPSRPAASVLVLAAHTISSSGTIAGDRLIVCPPGEMKRRLEKVADLGPELQAQQNHSSWQSSGTFRDRNTIKASGNVLEWVDRSRVHPAEDHPSVDLAAETFSPAPVPGPAAPPPPEPAPKFVEPTQKKAKSSKGWLQRLSSNEPADPRQTPREALSWLAAYFFTGGTPVEHGIRDISLSGFYVFTEERWYLGTVIRVTLLDRRHPTANRSLTVNAKVMRWGNDGVGLQFVLTDAKNQRQNRSSAVEDMVMGVTKEQIEEFLQRSR